MLNRIVNALRGEAVASDAAKASTKTEARTTTTQPTAKKSNSPAQAKTQITLPSDPLADRVLTGTELGSSIEAPDFVANHTATGHRHYFKAIDRHFADGVATAADTEAVRSAVTFERAAELADVVTCLRRYGIAIFPSLYGDTRFTKVVAEFDDLISGGEAFATGVDAREETVANSYALRLRRSQLPGERFAELHALFASPILEAITKEFFSGQSFEFNEHLYAQTTGPTEEPASGVLHWDKQLTLKSWLYVSDGGPEYGAMRAAATSNAWLRYVREDAMYHGLPYGQIDNAVPEDDLAVISSGGPAGTFFLFVTDTAHGASPVSAGRERRILRAQSRPKRITDWAAWAQKRG